MESPFDNNSTIVFYLEPILNPYNRVYQNVITLSCMPEGPLNDLVITKSFPKLSPFQQGPTTHRDQCMYVLSRYPKQSTPFNMGNQETFMNGEDVPSLLSYLSTNGYKVESDLTRLIFDSNIKNTMNNSQRYRKLICYATFRNEN